MHELIESCCESTHSRQLPTRGPLVGRRTRLSIVAFSISEMGSTPFLDEKKLLRCRRKKELTKKNFLDAGEKIT